MPQNVSVTTPEALGPISVVSTGDPRNSQDIRTYVQRLLNMIAGAAQVATPTATVLPFAGSAIPSGWLPCNGQSLNRGDYPALFAAIGTTYGSASGTTFNLPDLRGRVVVGVGQGASLTNRTLGTVGGEEQHALTIQELPAHTHQAPTALNNTTGTYEVPPAATVAGFSTYDYAGAAPTDATGGNAGHNTMQPYLTLNYIIRS